MTDNKDTKRTIQEVIINQKGNNDQQVIKYIQEQIKKANKEIDKIGEDLQKFQSIK